MSLIPYQPFFDFDQLWKSMKSPSGETYGDLLSPKVDITENDKSYLISSEFPGVESDKLNVTLERSRRKAAGYPFIPDESNNDRPRAR